MQPWKRLLICGGTPYNPSLPPFSYKPCRQDATCWEKDEKLMPITQLPFTYHPTFPPNIIAKERNKKFIDTTKLITYDKYAPNNLIKVPRKKQPALKSYNLRQFPTSIIRLQDPSSPPLSQESFLYIYYHRAVVVAIIIIPPPFLQTSPILVVNKIFFSL